MMIRSYKTLLLIFRHNELVLHGGTVDATLMGRDTSTLFVVLFMLSGICRFLYNVLKRVNNFDLDFSTCVLNI